MKIIKQGVVFRADKSFFAYQAWPSACVDENGTVYAVCSGFRAGHLCPFGKIVLFKSRGGGEKWSLPTVVCDTFLDDRDPGILYLGSGKMLVTRAAHPASEYETEYLDWIHSDSGDAGTGLVKEYAALPESEREGGCFYRFLYDYGETAGDEKRIPVHTPHGPILLKDGTVFYLGKELYAADVFSVYTSADGGETFVKTGGCPIPGGYGINQFHEVHCAELPDGKIMALFRTHLEENDDTFTMFKTFSADRGKTWSEWEPTGICGSPPHLCVADGRIVLTYGRRVPQYGIYGREVFADGSISQDEICLFEGVDDDLGYPATVMLPDKTLLTVYYARYDGDKKTSILYTKWTLD